MTDTPELNPVPIPGLEDISPKFTTRGPAPLYEVSPPLPSAKFLATVSIAFLVYVAFLTWVYLRETRNMG